MKRGRQPRIEARKPLPVPCTGEAHEILGRAVGLSHQLENSPKVASRLYLGASEKTMSTIRPHRVLTGTMTEPISNGPTLDDVLVAFLERYWKDRDAGVKKSLHHYLILFPAGPLTYCAT